MPTNKQYDDHSWVLAQLKKAQDVDHDNREMSREAVRFISERGGQWEDNWKEACSGRPQYTFDLTNPMIEQITTTIAKNDYTIKVLPAGGQASKEAAELYDGVVRHIEAISNAGELYSQVGRSMAVRGVDGWEVVQAYNDSDSFDQDLLIKKVPNWLDRVWFAPHTEQDASDAPYAWKLAGLNKDDYESDYADELKDRDIASVGNDRTSLRYANRNDLIMVGTFYYFKTVKRVLVQMSNGKVYEENEDFNALADEFAAAGITEINRRTRPLRKVCMRVFDNNGWLGKSQETVFENWIPLVPCYANFDYVEDKVIYKGAVETMMDWQRVYNYSMSREIEEGAFAPRAKYWMTSAQAEGHTETLETLNTNNNPVQIYNADAEAGIPPTYMGGAQINAGLRTISEAMQGGISMGAGMPQANMGQSVGYEQSGKAIDLLQERGDDGSNKYIEARKVAQRQTGRILVNTIKRVYKPGRIVRVLAEDGSFEMETLGEEVLDQQTGRTIVLNDLSEGQYDVTCEAGPSFKTRQGATVSSMVQLGAVDPSVIQTAGDVIAKNISAPGMDIVAKRKRRQLFLGGVLLPEELTDEENAELQQMQQSQQQQQDPNMVLAMAEQAKAQSDLMNSQTKQAETQAKIEQGFQNNQIESYKAETDRKALDLKWIEIQNKAPVYETQALKNMSDAMRQPQLPQGNISRF